jgi:hypothetical protein
VTAIAPPLGDGMVTGLTSLRPRRGGVPGYATRIALRELGRRAEFLDGLAQNFLSPLVVPGRCPLSISGFSTSCAGFRG